MNDPVIHIDDVPGVSNLPNGSSRFGAVVATLGTVIGAQKLGATYVQVEPGKRAFPYHNHHANEEMFVVLEGEGTYRIGNREYPLHAGCVCAAPPGGPETAHQVINTGTASLKYLAISTRIDPEICEYPDSGKFLAAALGGAENYASAHLRSLHRAGDSLDYWEGEEL